METAHVRRKQTVLNYKKIFAGRNSFLIIGALIISLFMILKFRSFFIFLIIGIIAGLINYFVHVTDIHVHLGHVPFIAIVFSYALGFKFGLFVIIIAHLLPEVMAGHVDMEMIISAAVYVLICFLAVILNHINIVTLGLILTFIQAILTFSLEKMSGTPVYELITENGVEFILLIGYFGIIAKPLLKMLGV